MRGFARLSSFVLVALGLFVLASSDLLAGPPTVIPEIDPAAIVSGLGLLGAGVYMLRARRSK